MIKNHCNTKIFKKEIIDFDKKKYRLLAEYFGMIDHHYGKRQKFTLS